MRAGWGEEADFYLHHTYDGEESMEEAIFVDPKCTLLPKSQNIVIYGHNMRNGEMFGTLKNYADKEFMKLYSQIRFDTIYEKGLYRVIGVLRTRILNQNEDGFRYYQTFQMKSERMYRECEKFINENLIFGEPVELEFGDELLMLSTCEYSQENGRLVVVAKKERK